MPVCQLDWTIGIPNAEQFRNILGSEDHVGIHVGSTWPTGSLKRRLNAENPNSTEPRAESFLMRCWAPISPDYCGVACGDWGLDRVAAARHSFATGRGLV